MMNYKQGDGVLELLHDGSMTTEVSVEGGSVIFYSDIDDYRSDCIVITIEEWEKVKEWVDKKVAEESVSEKF